MTWVIKQGDFYMTKPMLVWGPEGSTGSATEWTSMQVRSWKFGSRYEAKKLAGMLPWARIVKLVKKKKGSMTFKVRCDTKGAWVVK